MYEKILSFLSLVVFEFELQEILWSIPKHPNEKLAKMFPMSHLTLRFAYLKCRHLVCLLTA